MSLQRYVPELLRRRWSRAPDAFAIPSSESVGGSLLFADVSGFSDLMDRQAKLGKEGVEQLTGYLNRYFGQLIDQMHQHGGDVVGFAGDAISVFFADQGDGDLSSLRAAQCALDVQQRLDRFDVGRGVELRMRIVLSSGVANLITVGGLANRSIFFVAGGVVDPIKGALRLAEPGAVVVASTAWSEIARHCTGDGLLDGAARLRAIREPVPVRPLSRAPEDAAANPVLDSLVPDVVRSWQAGGHGRWLAELRRATSVFVELPRIDFSRTDWLGSTDEVVRAVQGVVEEYEGSIDKVSADDKGLTLFAAWGQPTLVHEDDPARAVHAATAIHDALAELGHAASIGVTTGDVYCGVVGNDARAEYTMMGAPVNLAARLMQQAAGRVLVDGATRDAASRRFDFVARPEFLAKGFALPVTPYEPSGVRTRQGDRHTVALVGRDEEQTRMVAALARLKEDGLGSVLVLEGEAGIGKSRLIAELRRLAATQSVRALYGEADAIERATPYHAWRPLIADLVGIAYPTDVDQLSQHVVERYTDRPEVLARLPLLNAILPFDLPESDFTAQLSDKVRSDNLHSLVARLLKEAADTGPIAVVLDDLHWFDTASWALLRVVTKLVPHACYLLGTRPMGDPQPAEFAELLTAPEALRYQLVGLPPKASVQLACRKLGVASLPEELSRLLTEKAEGNPFYTEELILSLREAGHIRVQRGECRISTASGRLDEVALPATVQGVVTSRIDRLPAEQQLFLKVASVLGRTFALGLVAALYPQGDLPVDPEALVPPLAQLDIIRPVPGAADGTYEFRHVIASEAVYDVLLFAQKRELHAAVVAWYESHRSDDVETLAPLLGHHATRAEDWTSAVHYLELAGAQALARSAPRECIRVHEQLMDIAQRHGVAADDARTAGWQWHLTQASFAVGDLPGCKSHAFRTLRLLGHPMAEGKGGQLLGLLGHVLARVVGMRKVGDGSGIDDAERSRRLRILAVQNRLTEIGMYTEDPLLLFHSGLRELALAEPMGPTGALARSYASMSMVLGTVPMTKVSLAWADLAEKMLDRFDDPEAHAYVLSRLGLPYLDVADWEHAEAVLDRSVTLAHELGDLRLQIEAHAILGNIRHFQGHHADQYTHFDTIEQLARLSGDGQSLCWAHYHRGFADVERGRIASGLRHLEASREFLVTHSPQADWIQGQGCRARGLQLAGKADEALALVEGILEKAPGRAVAYWTWTGLYAVCVVSTDLWADALARGDRRAADARGDLARRAVKAISKSYAAVFPFGKAMAEAFGGRVVLLSGDTAKATSLLENAVQKARTQANPWAEALAHDWLADAVGRATAKGISEARAAEELYESLGMGSSDGLQVTEPVAVQPA